MVLKIRICGVITTADIVAVRAAVDSVDLFEVRIDMIGAAWRDVARQLERPWLACNRRAEEGGHWRGTEAAPIDELLAALDMGAAMVDVELATPGLADIVPRIKARAECLVSYHNFNNTPPAAEMENIIQKELAAGADICKLVTTANSVDDNIALLSLLNKFPQSRLVVFSVGAAGGMSRILGPLAGSEFTYGSLSEGRESAPGQFTVGQLKEIFGRIRP